MQKRNLVAATCVGIIAIITVLLILSNNNKTSESSDLRSGTTRSLPTELLITLGSDGFSPQSITIAKGTAVRWSNKSGFEATVNSDDHPTHQRYKGLNLGIFQSGDTLVHIFTNKGTYKYHNHLNPQQTGTVIVQ